MWIKISTIGRMFKALEELCVLVWLNIPKDTHLFSKFENEEHLRNTNMHIKISWFRNAVIIGMVKPTQKYKIS